MELNYEELDYQQTPLGDLMLRCRRVRRPRRRPRVGGRSRTGGRLCREPNTRKGYLPTLELRPAPCRGDGRLALEQRDGL